MNKEKTPKALHVWFVWMSFLGDPFCEGCSFIASCCLPKTPENVLRLLVDASAVDVEGDEKACLGGLGSHDLVMSKEKG